MNIFEEPFNLKCTISMNQYTVHCTVYICYYSVQTEGRMQKTCRHSSKGLNVEPFRTDWKFHWVLVREPPESKPNINLRSVSLFFYHQHLYKYIYTGDY